MTNQRSSGAVLRAGMWCVLQDVGMSAVVKAVDQIRTRREALGLSVETLARLALGSESAARTIRNFESGAIAPADDDTLRAVLAALETAEATEMEASPQLRPALAARLRQSLLTARPDTSETRMKLFLKERAADLVEIRMALAVSVGKAAPGQATAPQIRMMIEVADFESADRALATVESSLRSAARKGDIRYLRGSLAVLECDLPKAASHFRAACDHIYAYSPSAACELRNKAGTKLYGCARNLGNGHDLPIGLFRSNLTFWRREWHPEKWAMTQVNLGNALFLSASAQPREAQGQPLDEAIESFRNALQIYSETTNRREWTLTQSAFAAALTAQARRVGGAAAAGLLGQASAAYRAALHNTNSRVRPLAWAAGNSQLAVTLNRQVPQAAEASQIKLLQDAAEADTAALGIYRQDVAPLHRISVQNSLANSLREQAGHADKSEGFQLLSRAAAIYREALEVCDRSNRAQEWSSLHHNLALTLLDLAKISHPSIADATLGEAMRSAHAAIGTRDSINSHSEWMSTKVLIGDILAARAAKGRSGDCAQYAAEAIKAFREVIAASEASLSPAQHFHLLMRTGMAHETAAGIGAGQDSADQYSKATAHFEAAQALAARARLAQQEKTARACRDRIKLRRRVAA